MEDIIKCLMVTIPTSKENAIHQKALAEKLGVNASTLKKYIQLARRNGINICSGNEGYWLAENEADIKAFENMLRKQALTRLKTTKPIRDSLKEYKGQMSLTDTFTSISEEVDTDE